MALIDSTDIAVIGGGPAGITACLELDKSSNFSINLFESDSELGGIPRSCNVFFGMRDQKRLYTGKQYARKLENKIRSTEVKIHTNATVLEITPSFSGSRHQICVASLSGMKQYNCRFIVIATGCYEATRQARLIPGQRPSGIFTTGSLQKLVNIHKAIPGSKAVILGSEIVSLSCLLTLKNAGIKTLGIIEDAPELQTYKLAAYFMKVWNNFRIFTDTQILSILGEKRVEGIRLRKNENVFEIECDTIVITGKFRPESALLNNTKIIMDQHTRGPVVDKYLMTSAPGVYAAGNVIRGARMHDLCALEGKQVARTILNKKH